MSSTTPHPEAVLRRLDWTVIRRLDGLMQGDYRTLFRGFGLELADLREYQPGDDVRFIDWNVTARTQVPYVRQYLEDREITAWFLLDLSPSVDFGSSIARKMTLLIDFVAVLARLLCRHGNRVGAITYIDGIDEVIPARNGKAQVLRLINDLTGRAQTRHAATTNLSTLLDTAARTIRRRSLIFIVSDYYSVPGWDVPLGGLTQRHEVLVVRLMDPDDNQLPDIGPILLEDAETGEQLFVDTGDRQFQRRFKASVQRREHNLEITFNRLGLDVLSLTTGGDLARDIVQFATMRKRKRAIAVSKQAAMAGLPEAPLAGG